ncbi:NADAR family protein [uncultured Mucilaginibacter sp.]|uniref:NADAR family protein n=1 Tax=uncultured Mucilaginibacter sp. TaxID=797541 RepID=UPI0025DD7547|nr:NADAR family protein [uncultured Mucilaginibacter sp.]
MTYSYSLKWLTDKFDQGETLKFLFFWGHSKSSKELVGKFCFSQWFELPFIVDNISYKTAEHWMMGNKALLFDDLKTHQKIINAKSPGEAKELGRQVLGFDEQIWLENRLEIVVNGNIHKFNQHPQFANFLINTNGRILVEASPVDKIWGIGLSKDAEQIENPYFWNGQNLLGFALMEVRDFFIEFGNFNYHQSQVSLPWKIYPQIDPHDLFWRMGNGEDIISKFSVFYSSLSDSDKNIFRLTNPTPYNWRNFYGI